MGRKNLEAALSQKLPMFPFRDWSWRYWNALSLAGGGVHWATFVEWVQGYGIRKACTLLRTNVLFIPEYQKFLRVLGTNPHNCHRLPKGMVWTKGGCWRPESNMTKLLVRKDHIEGRIYVQHWQKKLGRGHVRRLERELMNLIDPNTDLPHECKDKAAKYAKRRIAQLLGYRRVGWEKVAWFFQTTVPASHGTVAPIKGTGYTQRMPQSLAWDW